MGGGTETQTPRLREHNCVTEVMNLQSLSRCSKHYSDFVKWQVRRREQEERRKLVTVRSVQSQDLSSACPSKGRF